MKLLRCHPSNLTTDLMNGPRAVIVIAITQRSTSPTTWSLSVWIDQLISVTRRSCTCCRNRVQSKKAQTHKTRLVRHRLIWLRGGCAHKYNRLVIWYFDRSACDYYVYKYTRKSAMHVKRLDTTHARSRSFVLWVYAWAGVSCAMGRRLRRRQLMIFIWAYAFGLYWRML